MPDDRCTWCGHPSHEHPCPRDITTQGSKTPTTEPCPCTRGLRFVTHIITCTAGCDEPELCDDCPCHEQEET